MSTEQQTEPEGALDKRLSAAISAIAPAVVQIHGTASPVTASGIVWTADGIVVTTHSGTWNDQGIQVGLANGDRHPALVIGRDPTTDLLVLQLSGLEAGGEPLTVPARRDLDGLSPGNLAIAVGRRHDGVRASWGSLTEVGGPWTTALGGRVDGRLDVDAGLPRGLTGSALVDIQGQLIGVNTRRLDRGGTTIPVATIDRVVALVQAQGSLRPAWLGAAVLPVELPAAVAEQAGQSHGLILLGLTPDGPADHAGLLQGDVLLTLGDAALTSPRALRAALGPDTIGAEQPATYVRAGALAQAAVSPAARPEGLDDEHDGHGGHGGHGGRHHGGHGGHGRWGRGGRWRRGGGRGHHEGRHRHGHHRRGRSC